MRHRLIVLYTQSGHQFRRTLSSVSRAGFSDYDKERREFKWNKPEYYNFTRDCFDNWARKAPQHTALWMVDDSGRSIKVTYGKMSELSMRLANGLQHACGLGPGSRVIMILPRIPEWWILNLSCTRTGIVFCPGTTLLTPKDIDSRLISSKADAIIIDEANMHKIQEIEENHPHLKKICVSEQHCPTGWWKFSDLMDKGSDNHQCVDTLADDPMSLYFTSGTTGLPKMVEHTHASQGLGHIVSGRHWLDLTENDLMWTNADTGWAKAAYSMVFGPWTVGATVFTHNTPQFNPETTMKILQDYPITTFCSPPTIYRFLVQQDLAQYDIKSVTHTVSAAEPLNPEVRDEWKAGTGLTLLEGYGQSETTLCCGTFRCIELRPGSMGKATPGFDMSVVDDEGQEVELHQEGNLAIRVAPVRPVGLFTHYVDDAERTRSVFVGDYYLTGDRAYQDEDGYFWFVGRNDDVILSAGYRIGPFEVESALIEHPAVLESAVVSSPDQTRGEVVKAFVVLSQQCKNQDLESLTDELQNHVKQTTAPYKYPRKIEFVESLPKTVSGKTRRVELREREWQAVRQ